MERLSDYIQGERVVRELRHHAPEALEALACDLEQPLNPPLALAVARSLDDGRVPHFRASEVLMPAMMATFAVNPAAIEEQALAELKASCNCCEEIGRCWQAMRDRADGEVCRSFCPNAEAFIGHGGQQGQPMADG
ncbi:hypothetical protein HOP54_22305 [Halomonas daqingensis]|uniref:hypothetical protein n=1 Tax=Halomonadaceae TaxID=28256 RepID=UPI000289541E|nr:MULTISPECIES: hypothetical protein [Halomonas]MCE8031424.1 hypothetical protein [Halomonas desiderata]OUE43998.1 hypothetical protein BZY95_06895 [Halomonas desiderata SP1]